MTLSTSDLELPFIRFGPRQVLAIRSGSGIGFERSHGALGCPGSHAKERSYNVRSKLG